MTQKLKQDCFVRGTGFIKIILPKAKKWCVCLILTKSDENHGFKNTYWIVFKFGIQISAYV